MDHRVYEITDVIDNWLENVRNNPDKYGPNSFDFKNYFSIINVNKTEAKRIKEFYKNETADYDELEKMPTTEELELMSEYDKDQWLQLKEAYSHITLEEVKNYQLAIKNILNAVDNVIQ